jgi:hypothetical protein
MKSLRVSGNRSRGSSLENNLAARGRQLNEFGGSLRKQANAVEQGSNDIIDL